MIHPQKSQKFGFLPQIGEFFILKSKIKSKKSFLTIKLCTTCLRRRLGKDVLWSPDLRPETVTYL